MLTCNHNHKLNKTGLCDQCEADFDTDPCAFAEYGPHPEGEANWQALLAEMAADDAAAEEVVKLTPAELDDIPF